MGTGSTVAIIVIVIGIMIALGVVLYLKRTKKACFKDYSEVIIRKEWSTPISFMGGCTQMISLVLS